MSKKVGLAWASSVSAFLGGCLRRFMKLITAPGWQGWGTILSGLTLLATTAVAVILFQFAQDEDQKRLDQQIAVTRANLSVQASLIKDEETGLWWLYLILLNEGPADTEPFAVDLELIYCESTPKSRLIASKGRVLDAPVDAYSKQPHSGWHPIEIRVEESLLPGDSLHIMRGYFVSERYDEALGRHISADGSIFAFVGSEVIHGRFIFWSDEGPNQSAIGNFLRYISVRGSNVGLSQSWRGIECDPSPSFQP